MRLQCVFEEDIDKIYDIAIGSTFVDNYSEELSSGKIILSHIPQANRLISLSCYEYVYIYDLDSDFGKYFLVDNYSENIQNVKDLYYEYTISLMSETKMLEKIQLPNRVITHSLVSGQKTIREMLYRFCFSYIPKIKFTTDNNNWAYKYIFDFSDLLEPTSDIYNKFDILCPDISFSQPTLRQALTQIMQVVGCIPIITNRKLSFLDLRAETTIFNVANTNYITKSMSSDSYVNTLTNMGDNILDNKNQIISEVLGFRDKDNVYLKQTENLTLETSKPIYNVVSFSMCAYVKKTIRILNAGSLKVQVDIIDRNSDYSVRLNLVDTTTTTLYNTKVIFVKTNSSGRLIKISELDVGNLDTNDKYYQYTKPTGTQFMIIYGYASANSTSDSDLVYCNNYINENNYLNFSKDIVQYFYYEKDITPLLVEDSKRSALETDFLAMQSVASISDLSKYYYGTVGYTIGTKKISGFSKTYTQSNGFWDETKTYIENIWNAVFGFDNYGDKTSPQDIVDFYLLISASEQISNIATPTIYSPLGSTILFTSLFFNIKYRPLNSLNVKYLKDTQNINVPIEQLDTQETSIPSFDDMASKETQKVNRLGNNVYQISQRLTNLRNINPLNSLYDSDKVVFKREYAIYNDFAQVTYTASKDYVLKNYFTSIQTKYRAYEYVDYNKSVVRKENKTVFVLIDNFYFNGDDNIWVGSLATYNDHNELGLLMSGALHKTDSKDNLLYFTFSTDGLGFIPYKNEMSSIVANNIMAFNYQELDNASAGTYIKVLTPQNGGLPQSWLMFTDEYYDTKRIGFIGKTNFISSEKLYTESSYADNELAKVYKEPNCPVTVFNPWKNDNPNIWLVNNNSGVGSAYTDYKDYSEIINRTLEFVYYTTSVDIEWKPKFIELCELYDYETLNTNNKMVLSVDNPIMSENAKLASGVSYIDYNDNYVSLDTTNTKAPCIRVHWGSIDAQYKYIEIINLVGSDYYDVIKFHRPNDTSVVDSKYYISLNDNKTNKVYSLDNTTGLWYSEHMVMKNDFNRNISLDDNEFRVSLVYFSEDYVVLEDFDTNKVYFSEEVETV